MLRNNLSTRPFYNERAVHALLGLVAAVVAVLTAINLYEIVRLSRQNTELSSRIDQNRGEAAKLTREAARIRKGINQEELEVVVNAAREANTIIEQRTFSWTAFFEFVEKTLPRDTRLIAVAPRVERGEFRIAMIVVAKRPEDLKTFTDALQGTGVFYDVAPSAQQLNDDGTFTATIQGGYLPAAPPAGTSVKPPVAAAAPPPAGGKVRP